MLFNSVYFRLKPILPRPIRMGIRRALALRKLERTRDTWPILPGSEQPPVAWPGWPEGKQFAFVLTHDVESVAGLGRVKQLAELEMKYGFRSCFNFIPEGPYFVPRDLRSWLRDHGFEVGVHDLNHDGHLFSSRHEFRRRAKRINEVLKDWEAVGFRSAYMLRNLDWIGELDIAYDASTFDTDPFEPQPDGVNTIFPFWSHFNGNGRGYVELPYTMAQDSTLFLLLRAQSINVWKTKLDWLASQRGMVLLNVHPDYLDFAGRSDSSRYPIARYQELLSYVRCSYDGLVWHSLPRELAAYCADFRPKRLHQPLHVSHPQQRTVLAVSLRDSLLTSLDRGTRLAAASRHTSRLVEHNLDRVPSRPPTSRAAVVLFSTYPADPRPRRAAEALLDHGFHVEVICLREDAEELADELFNGVRITRVPLRHRRAGKLRYIAQYVTFTFVAGAILALRSLRGRYDLVHVHNMPDFLILSALVPKLLGAHAILDLHDPMPELMITIYGLDQHSFPVRLLKVFERLSIRLADAVITVNEACKKIFSARSCAPTKVTVIMNSPDPDIFECRSVDVATTVHRDVSKPFVIMYHGSLVERHGLDVAVAALAKVRKSIPNAQLLVYGRSTEFLTRVLASIEESPLRRAVRYLGPKNLEGIVEAIRNCDVGVIPNRRSLFTELNTPTRIFEYLSQGKPVIAPRAPGILDYFNEQDLILFTLGDADDLANKIDTSSLARKKSQALFSAVRPSITLTSGRANACASYGWSMDSSPSLVQPSRPTAILRSSE